MNSLGIAVLELKRLSRNRFARVATIVVCLIPLLYSFLYLDAFWDPYHNLESMRVAVVNQDQATSNNNQIVRAGEELVNTLKTDHTVGWSFTDESAAIQGLSNGYYELVVIIPSDFSKTILNSSKDPITGTEPKKAQLFYFSNPSNNFLATQIGNKITAELKGNVNGQIASNFFENVFGKLSDMRDTLQTASDGASQLQDGLTQVTDGSHKLTSGLTSLSSGSSTLVSGLTQAGDQLQSASLGANQLKSGSQSAHSASASLQSGLAELGQGSKAVQGGLGLLHDGLNQMKVKLDDSTEGIPALITAASQLSGGTANLQAEVTITNSSLDSADQTLNELLSDPLLTDSQKQKIIGTLQQVQGAQALLNAPGEISPGVYSIKTNLAYLNQGATRLSGGLQMLHTQSDQGLTQLLDSSQLLVTGSSSLAEGITQASTGATQLNQGLQTLSDGTVQLAAGLTSGASSFPELIEGGNLLLTAVFSLNHGSQTLTSGMDDLKTGGLTLSTGLKEGVTQLSQQLPQNRQIVAANMGSPVIVEETQIHPVSNYGTGFTPYFIPLALWVGSLILFFLINIKENRLTTSGVSRLSIVLGKFWTLAILGAFQAIISSFSLISALGLHPSNTLGFYGFNILLSWSFIAIIQLLVQAFGMAGRFLAIVMLMLQLTSCGGTFPMELVPKFFQVINPYLPMTYGTAGLRQIISGSASIPLITSVLVLIAFTVGAILITILISSNWVKVSDLHPTQELAS